MINKKKAVFSMILAVSLLTGVSSVYAGNGSKSIKALIGGVSCTLNGNSASIGDAITYNGKIYVPVEDAAKAMDAQVDINKGKVAIKTGPYRNLKYPVDEETDAITTGISSTIKKAPGTVTSGDDSIDTFNKLSGNPKDQKFVLNNNFSSVTFQIVYNDSDFESYDFRLLDINKKEIPNTAVHMPWHSSGSAGKIVEASLDVRGAYYLSIEATTGNSAIYNITVTGK